MWAYSSLVARVFQGPMNGENANEWEGEHTDTKYGDEWALRTGQPGQGRAEQWVYEWALSMEG